MMRLAFKLVAKCIRLFPKSKKVTRSDLLTEVKTVSGKTVVPVGVSTIPRCQSLGSSCYPSTMFSPRTRRPLTTSLNALGYRTDTRNSIQTNLFTGLFGVPLNMFICCLPAKTTTTSKQADYCRIAWKLRRRRWELPTTPTSLQRRIPILEPSTLSLFLRRVHRRLLHDIGKVFWTFAYTAVIDNGNLMWGTGVFFNGLGTQAHGVQQLSGRVPARPGARATSGPQTTLFAPC